MDLWMLRECVQSLKKASLGKWHLILILWPATWKTWFQFPFSSILWLVSASNNLRVIALGSKEDLKLHENLAMNTMAGAWLALWAATWHPSLCFGVTPHCSPIFMPGHLRYDTQRRPSYLWGYFDGSKDLFPTVIRIGRGTWFVSDKYTISNKTRKLSFWEISVFSFWVLGRTPVFIL